MRDQNAASVHAYHDKRHSLFLESGDPDARLEVYASNILEGSAISSVGGGGELPQVGLNHLSAAIAKGSENSTIDLQLPPTSGDGCPKFIPLKDPKDLEQTLRLENGFEAYFIRQYQSYSPLSITRDLFEALVLKENVPSQFKDYLIYLGERESEVEISPKHLKWSAKSNAISDQDYPSFDCMYGVRFVELNGRGSPEDLLSRWSLRQSAIYGSFVHPQKTTWIFVTPSKLAQDLLDEYLSCSSRTDTIDPFDVHSIILEAAITNWRPFLVDFRSVVDQHTAQLLAASPNGQGPLSLADCGERQTLLILENKLIDASMAVKATIDNATALLRCYETIQSSLTEESRAKDAMHMILTDQCRELGLIMGKIDAMRSNLQGVSNCVSSFLDLNNGFTLQQLVKESGKENEAMHRLSKRMHELTKKSNQDAVAVKVLTILTLIYLPATVVSNFFSTSFVNSSISPGGRGHISVSGDWWIFVAAVVPLTLLTLYIWFVWMRIQAFSRYPWWWRMFRRASKVPSDCSEKI
jgi:Mg2+ and Co2+ transporter CorA